MHLFCHPYATLLNLADPLSVAQVLRRRASQLINQSGALSLSPCVHAADCHACSVGVPSYPWVNPLQPEQAVTLAQLNKRGQLLVETQQVALTGQQQQAGRAAEARTP